MKTEPSEGLVALKAALMTMPNGPVQDPLRIEQVLIACWDELRGSSENRTCADKLARRTESMQWEYPWLTFKIERHGATMMGSTRANMNNWRVNVQTGEAQCTEGKRRQIKPMDARLNVMPLAEEMARAIRLGLEAFELKWINTERVKVLTYLLIEGNNAQTIAGRCKRFYKCLDELLQGSGWVRVKKTNIYQRSKPA